jgi:hypothetical protein
VSLVGRRVCLQSSQSIQSPVSAKVYVYASACLLLFTRRAKCGWQLSLTVVRLFQTPTPTKERRKIPFWQVK